MKRFKIQEKSQTDIDLTFYLSVEPNYYDPADGTGRTDSVLFEIGQQKLEEIGIDAMISCSVDDARRFAEAILKTCDEIESK